MSQFPPPEGFPNPGNDPSPVPQGPPTAPPSGVVGRPVPSLALGGGQLPTSQSHQLPVEEGSSTPLAVAGAVAALCGVAMCASSFMTWSTIERIGQGTRSTNGFDDLDATLSWGPLVVLCGCLCAVFGSMVVTMTVRRGVGPVLAGANLVSLGLAAWQATTLLQLESALSADPGVGYWTWLVAALMGFFAGVVVWA